MIRGMMAEGFLGLGRRRAYRLVVAMCAGTIGSWMPGVASAASTAVGSASNGSPTARLAITIGVPGGTQAGDVMVASVVSNDDDPGFLAPGGWSLVRQDTVADALRQAIYLRVATASEPAAYTWTVSTQRRLAGGITTYSGVDTTNPVDVHGSRVTTTASTAVTAPSVTTTTADTLLVHFAAVNTEGTISPPPGMTERWEASAPRANSSRDATASASDSPQAIAGPTGPRTATTTQAGRSIAAVVALRPGGPPLPDLTPPETSIVSGPTGTVLDTSATFAFTANEPATFRCSLDSGTDQPCSSPTTYASLGEGAHTFAVSATDTAGNTDPTPASRSWTIDTTGPPPVAGIITTVAGNGTAGFSGDGGPAVLARLNEPRTIAVDVDGSVYITDTYNQRIRRVSPDGVITTVAGNGQSGFGGDGGPAVQARLQLPHSVALDAAGNLYIADSANHRIRKVDRTGTIFTVAGSGTSGYSGDGGAATQARLNHPKGVDIGADGLLYIADSLNHRVRRVDAAGRIATIAGTGTAGFSGDAGPATAARLNRPRNIVFDAAGRLWIADDLNYRVRLVSAGGTIRTYAGTGESGFSGDGGPAVEARFSQIRDIALDTGGNLFIADELNNRIRRVDSSGTVTTYAGSGVRGYGGDGGPATAARLNHPRGVAIDLDGRLVLADTFGHRIRRVG